MLLTDKPRTPLKVLQTAVTWGAHNDCLLAGAGDLKKACEQCIHIVIDSLEYHYPSEEYKTAAERVSAIMDDIINDYRNEQPPSE